MIAPAHGTKARCRRCWSRGRRRVARLVRGGVPDHIAALGEDASVPTERAASVAVPTLIMDGSESFPFMHATAQTLADAIPHAQHRTLEGQTHEVAAEALAPVLIEFFKD